MPALDGIRAVSVFLVILSHGGIGGGGSLGVNAFFVVSGFLITHLLLKEHDASGAISLRDFYLRRSLRIFPAYYVFLALSLTVDHFQGDLRSKDDAVAALLYLQNYRNAMFGHSDSSVALSWSLGVEEQFYLLWPGVLLVLLATGSWSAKRFLILSIGGVLAWRCLAYGVLDFSQSWAYNAFDCRFDSLAIGCLLSVGLRDAGVRYQFERLGRSWLPPLLTVLLIMLPTYLAPRGWKHSVGFTYEALLVSVLIAQLLQQSGRGPWAWLEWRWIRYLGAISYSLYLYHGWGLGLGDNFQSLPHWAQFVLGCVAGVFLASCSYLFVEKPFLRLKDRLGHRHLVQEAMK